MIVITIRKKLIATVTISNQDADLGRDSVANQFDSKATWHLISQN